MTRAAIPALENSSDEGLPPERRAEARRAFARWPLISFLARPSFRAYQAVVREVSLHGIGLLSVRHIEPGSVLAIQLRSRNVGVSGILSATVRHTTAWADGNWQVGCSLSRPLTDEELWELTQRSEVPRDAESPSPG